MFGGGKMYKETYTQELKQHFGTDQRRINHALKVLHYAGKIMSGEGVDEKMRKVITVTALLHDVGIKAAEQKYHSSAGNYQELEGPPIAVNIMAKHGEEQALTERVAYIIGGHHTAAKNDGLDFQIIWEADLLVNIEEDGLTGDKNKLAPLIKKNFKTNTGLKIAEETYL